MIFLIKKIFCNATDDGVEPLISKDIITHNILSWAFALTETDLNNQPWALSAILYHHVVYGHLSDISARNIMIDLTDDEKETFFSFLNEINQYLRERFDFSIQLDDSNDGSVTPNSTTLYYDMYINQSRSNVGVQLEGNTLYTVARSVLIYADRLASSYPTFADRFANNDIELINSLLEDDLCSKTIPDDNYLDWAYNGNTANYDIERLQEQNVLMDKIDKCDNNVINASAGFGKTLIGLRWIMRNKKRVLWLTPRNVIANGTYDSIISELDTMGYYNRISVGLLLQGEYKYGDENSDIIVTNIDNFLSMMVKNNMAHNLLKELSGNVIFDEYHEFLCEQPLFAAFISYAYTRTNWTNSKSLFLSATAIRFDDYFCWDNINFIRPKAYNGDMKVKIHINKYNDINEFHLPETDKDSLVITHTVKQAQMIYKNVSQNLNDTSLLHAMFTDTRRKEIEDMLYKTHGKKSPVEQRNAVIGTNALSTGLNISAHNIYDFIINPEGTIQRGCGRGGRFGEKEYDCVNYHVCILEGDKSSDTFISRTYDKDLYFKWYKMLEEYNDKIITKDKLYELYDEFYSNNESLFMEYIYNTFTKSASCLKHFYPYATHKKDKNKSDIKKLSKSYSYRGEGNSIYVTARYTDNDELVCEPIVIDVTRILEDEIKEKEAQKYHYNEFKKNSDKSFKHIYKGWHACFPEDWFRIALSYDTPLALYFARYNDEIGLIMNEN
jgi:DEAD/DEAH box helicase